MRMLKLIKSQPPARIIAFGFALVILLGSCLFMLPCSVKEGVELRYIDALYMSTSAVCVTGLISVDVGDTFTPLGQFFLAVLIQTGGLGVTCIGAGVIVAMRRRVNLQGRNVIREAMNLNTGKGIVKFIKSVFLTTLSFELWVRRSALSCSLKIIRRFARLESAFFTRLRLSIIQDSMYLAISKA